MFKTKRDRIAVVVSILWVLASAGIMEADANEYRGFSVEGWVFIGWLPVGLYWAYRWVKAGA